MTEKVFLALSFFPARSSRVRSWWRRRRRGWWRSTGGRTRRWGREMGSGSRCGGCRTRDLSRWSWGRTTELSWNKLFFNATFHKWRTHFNVSRHRWNDYAIPYFVSNLLVSRTGFELTSFHLHLQYRLSYHDRELKCTRLFDSLWPNLVKTGAMGQLHIS